MLGNEDCTFDWLLIPGARGNLTNYGIVNYLINIQLILINFKIISFINRSQL